MNQDPTITRLEGEIQRLRVSLEELAILNDIATAISSIQTVEKIIDMIVQKCVKHLQVEQGAVMLFDEENADRPFHTMIRKQDSLVSALPYHLDTQLTGWMIKHKIPLLINDLSRDERFKWLPQKELDVKSLICVPMLVKGKLIGLLTVFNKKSGAGFTNDEQRLLSIIATQSAQIIENARLYQKEQALLLYQEEMRLAKEIQLTLLPDKAPEITGYQLAGNSRPANEVGGDYFDFITIDEKRLAFCLGDVSGKGMPAAMLMANLQATLRAQTHTEMQAAECLRRSNRLIYQSTDDKKFATLFYALLNHETHELMFCNGGHDNPILITNDGGISHLATGSIVLGFLPDFAYEQQILSVNPGDMLVIYSDGITEAMNEKEDEYGENRLTELIRKHRDRSASELIGLIFNEVEVHAGTAPQMDDQTLIILKRLS